MKGNLSISSAFVKGAVEGYQKSRCGSDVSTKSLVESAGVNWEILESSKGRITGMEFSSLIKKLWTVMDDEFIGFGNKKVKPGSFALMSQLSIGATTLRQALIRCIRFQRIAEITPLLSVWNEDDSKVIIGFNESNPPTEGAFIYESLLVFYHRFCSWLIDEAIPIHQAGFSYPKPAYSNDYNMLFRSAVKFSHNYTGICIDSEFLQKEIVKDSLALTKFLNKAPLGILFYPENEKSYSAKIRNYLLNSPDGVLPKFTELALIMHLTPQTLRRRLKQEGVTYNEIKENYRRDLAIYLLTRRKLPIKEVAEKLDYTETSTFHRAFKQWTGVTPMAYMEKHLAEHINIVSGEAKLVIM